MAKSKRKAASARSGRARTPSASAGPNPPGAKSTGTAGRTAATSTPTGESPLRVAVAERSRGPVVWLSHQPRFLIPGVMLVLMLVGLAAPLVFAIPALIAIFAFVCWLAFLSWPALDGRQRTLRVMMMAVIAIAVVGRIAGWF